MKINIDGINVRYELIRNNKITGIEACILSLFLDIDISEGIPSNKDLSILLNIAKPQISKTISRLKEKGFLIEKNIPTDKEIFNVLNKVNSDNGCTFCGYTGIAIDDHHYPIRRKDGGKKTISLCANCHREFHYLSDHSRDFLLSKEVENAR